MSWEGYRTSKLGEALQDALLSMVTQEKITPEQADLVMVQFDKSTQKFLGNNSVKAQLKGELHTYRSYDEVYTLLVKDCEVILSGKEISSSKGSRTNSKGKSKGSAATNSSTVSSDKVTLRSDMVKIVCQDAKVGQRPQR